ncbi:copper chaperone PCu(A)C [Streptomyces sp. MZ04]|uniref:copper chaperone PCu(A)C n=1 Tax=Streptomyces sp. MZ04 TaxID=2559236 RepID=UPI00107EDF23|nr:copper chaperone PCu(A)C [Streptomyces sp. MZ04]TGB15163.1 copper chaperone PCu(A)C [Streptomyces sp. MZ04]
MSAAGTPVRRLRLGASAAAPALAAALAGAGALAGLSAWTAAGAAGSAPELRVTAARVLLPSEGNASTAAVFRIRNTGGAADRLISVSSPTMGEAMLSRDAPVGERAARMSMVDSATVPAHGTLTMTPYGLDVMVELREPLRLGQRVEFSLRFEDAGSLTTEALVVRPIDWEAS